MKTKVSITVDTEFSIAGAFADPDRNKPVGPAAVWCEAGGRSHGLGFLLDTFAASGTRATFFVEALNTCYFGDQPMGDVARHIKAAGQEVQLHLHPCWTYFQRADWRQHLVSDPPSDHMYGRSRDQLAGWLQLGIDAFERWGIDRPLALRTGSMMADRTVYQAMQDVGVPLASNIGFAVYRPDDPQLHLYSGIHQVEGVTEACVLTYVDAALARRKHFKLLTITGTSWREMKILLLRARAAEVDAVVILTHPFEFVTYDKPGFTNLRPHLKNQRRLEQLCEFLAAHPDFEAASITGLAAQAPIAPGARNVLLQVPLAAAVERVAENWINGLGARA